MSDLVEKVALAINACPDWKSPSWEPEARAAIAAVAEWLKNRPMGWPPNAEGKISAALRIAAALRAAAEDGK